MNTFISATPTVITIDGPSGSGKGTLSQMLATRLGYHLLDSGALYRLVALAAMEQGAVLTDEAVVAAIAANLDVYFRVENDKTQVYLAEKNVTDAIRLEAVGMNASIVAAYSSVRSALLERQRAFASAPGLIADGRDMGTTVFPDAPIKIFLTASAEARALRRFKQLSDKSQSVDMAALISDIRKRDERDTQRAISPLKPAQDAILIDSTEMTIDEVLNAILTIVQSSQRAD